MVLKKNLRIYTLYSTHKIWNTRIRIKALKFPQISDIHLFISGETGVGKKTLAKYIHKASIGKKKLSILKNY